MSIVEAVPESNLYHELESDRRETFINAQAEFFQIRDERLFLELNEFQLLIFLFSYYLLSSISNC